MRALPLLFLGALAACSNSTDLPFDRGSHVERVLQDVTAILEGMAATHSERRVVLRGPEFRSSAPRGRE